MPLPPSKLPLSTEDMDRHPIHGSLGPSESSSQMASRSIQLFLEGSRLQQIYRPTDNTTLSVTIARIYIVQGTAMWPNDIFVTEEVY